MYVCMRACVKSWLKTRPPAEHEFITGLFESSYENFLEFAAQKLSFRAKVLDALFIRQALDLLQALIPLRDQREVVADKNHYERLYLFAIVWSIGALLDVDDRMKFDEFIRANESLKFVLPPTDNNFTLFDFRVEDQGLLRRYRYFNIYIYVL
jgi:dynein heavy chain